jgi:hypothetical protein
MVLELTKGKYPSLRRCLEIALAALSAKQVPPMTATFSATLFEDYDYVVGLERGAG